MKILTLILTTLICFKPVIGNIDLTSAKDILNSFNNCQKVSFEQLEACCKENEENLLDLMKIADDEFSDEPGEIFYQMELAFIRGLPKKVIETYLLSTFELPTELLNKIRYLMHAARHGEFK